MIVRENPIIKDVSIRNYANISIDTGDTVDPFGQGHRVSLAWTVRPGETKEFPATAFNAYAGLTVVVPEDPKESLRIVFGQEGEIKDEFPVFVQGVLTWLNSLAIKPNESIQLRFPGNPSPWVISNIPTPDEISAYGRRQAAQAAGSENVNVEPGESLS
jgi:hypothetical protein